MKRKILSILLAGAMATTLLAGCGSGSCAERLYNLSYIGFSYPAKDAAVLKQVECLIKCAGFWKLVKRR